jgi:hypothetical protein
LNVATFKTESTTILIVCAPTQKSHFVISAATLPSVSPLYNIFTTCTLAQLWTTQIQGGWKVAKFMLWLFMCQIWQNVADGMDPMPNPSL